MLTVDRILYPSDSDTNELNDYEKCKSRSMDDICNLLSAISGYRKQQFKPAEVDLEDDFETEENDLLKRATKRIDVINLFSTLFTSVILELRSKPQTDQDLAVLQRSGGLELFGALYKKMNGTVAVSMYA